MSEIRSWVEDDGTEVWLVGAEERGRIADLAECERKIRECANPGAVIGANAEASDPDRIAQLADAGYALAFSMIRMRRGTEPPVLSRRPDLRVRAAETTDADAMHELTRRVWAGRAWFQMPSLDDYRGWLTRWDRSLMLLAFDGAELIGYVAAERSADELRIDDVQTHPDHRRRGVASELIARVLVEGSARGLQSATLETEGGDPAGARSLYERLGFAVIHEALRLRKPVGSDG